MLKRMNKGKSLTLVVGTKLGSVILDNNMEVLLKLKEK